MILFPPAKINLGLRVLYKRPDNYHEIDSCMVPIPFYDVLEILPAEQFSFVQTGLIVDGDPESNLCVRAFRMMQTRFAVPNVYLHLRKLIPMGAGLGGGSSDGAFTLIALNQLFDLQIPEDKLMQYALTLGSDCPFFILNSPAFATGRGEILKPIHVNLEGYTIVIVNPGIAISTKLAFSLIIPKVPVTNLEAIICEPVTSWKDNLINDFEEPVSKAPPEIATIKQQLYNAGAVYACMTGSGSTVFGLFKKDQQIHLTFNNHYLFTLV